MSFYTNQVEKAISLTWSQWCIHKPWANTYSQYSLWGKLGRCHHFFTYGVLCRFSHRLHKYFCSRFPSRSPKIVKLCGPPFCEVITFSNPLWFEIFQRKNNNFKRNFSTMYFIPQLELIWSLCWTIKWSRVILIVFFCFSNGHNVHVRGLC
jgi:hypothetical protein